MHKLKYAIKFSPSIIYRETTRMLTKKAKKLPLDRIPSSTNFYSTTPQFPLNSHSRILSTMLITASVGIGTGFLYSNRESKIQKELSQGKSAFNEEQGTLKKNQIKSERIGEEDIATKAALNSYKESDELATEKLPIKIEKKEDNNPPNDSDLNHGGSPQKSSLIVQFAKQGNVQGLAALIQQGVTERPIDVLFRALPNFIGYHPCKLDEYKKKISTNLARNNLSGQCEVAVLLLSNPTSDLVNIISEIERKEVYNYRFLTLFVWAAKNNRADLLDVFHFKKLFQLDKNSAKEAVIVATAFGSVEFLATVIQESLLEEDDIKKACIAAAANGDNNLLLSLIKLSGNNLELINSSIDIAPGKTYKDYYSEIYSYLTPLFWAIRNDHKDTVKLLLEAGASPNETFKNDFNNGYIQLATCVGNTEIIKLLLTYGANINYQDDLGWSALHNAARMQKVDVLKFLIEAGADINLIDGKGKKALDRIKDKNIRTEIQEFIAPKDQAQDLKGSTDRQLPKRPFFSTLSPRVSDKAFSAKPGEKTGSSNSM